MVKKIFDVMRKTIIGLFLFYLIVSVVIIPLVVPWVISSQATKILKHPVRLKLVTFNPFLLRLSATGLDVQDLDRQTMIGFDRFSADLSFLSLFKKQYRVESLDLEGLKVNIILLAGGKNINLLDLVPKPISPSDLRSVPSKEIKNTTEKQNAATSSSTPSEVKLPMVIFDKIAITKGTINFVDQTISPNFKTTLHDMNIAITGLSTKPDCMANIKFDAGLDEKGMISNEVVIKPFAQPLEVETTFSLNEYALSVLTPYTGKYTGRTLKSGKLEFKMDYRIANNQLTAAHKVLIQQFEFGKKVESKDALPLPFGLVIGLLEDPQGRIKISLPVTGDMSKPDFHYWPLVGQVVRSFFFGLVTKPFSFLASTLGAESGMEDLGYVKFIAGKADLLEEEKNKIKLLITGLKDRPKLFLEVNGSYDPDSDWKAIKTETLVNEYKQLREKSTRSESWVYQMIYQRRFGIRELWGITKKYKSSTGIYEDAPLVEELKRQLVEKVPPDKLALEALATTRAKIVYDQMIAEGLGQDRLRIGNVRSTQASMGHVPLEFTLTVFEDNEESSAESQSEGILVE